MRRLVVFCFIIFCLICSVVRADPLDGLDYQSESVATADQITAGIFNPGRMYAEL